VRDRLAAIVAALALLGAGCDSPPTSPSDAGVDAAPGDAAWRDAWSATDAGSCPTVDFVAAMADPLAPARRLPGRAFLFSSRDPEPPSGMRNDDFGHFVGTDGERVVLVDQDGPGVITRLWFTYGPPMVGTIDDVPMRLSIDGADVPLDGMLDARLGTLASGSSPTFPAPWAMDPSVASGGLVIATPIHFAQHARVELTVAAGSWSYYQVDVRLLPSDVCVRSFDGTWTREQAQALRDAASVWQMHAHPGTDTSVPRRTLAAGESTTLDVTGPAAITTLEILSDEAARASLTMRIDVDGDVAAEAPVSWLTGSGAPAGHYESALTGSSAASAHLYAPIPIDSMARVTITNAGTAPTDVGLRARVLAMPSIPADVGHFRAECSTAVVSNPASVCEALPTEQYPNVILGASSRGPGQFAGITTFQTAPDPWWWALENDHEIVVDGSYDLLGTGTEDYFGGGFYFMNGPYASVLSGASGFTRMPEPAHTHLYRHHVVDTIPFDHDFRFEMETYVTGTRFDGCVFVYLF
jgi:hypothetical protein